MARRRKLTWLEAALVVPEESEAVWAKLTTGKELKLIYRDGCWIDPRYSSMVVEFLSVEFWRPDADGE